MHRTTFLLVVLAAACARERPIGPGPGADGGGGPPVGDGGIAQDGATPPPSDGGGVPTGDAGACTPLSGTLALEGYCQQVALSVLRFDDATPALFATGRLTSVGEGDEGCIAVDRVELRTRDGELVQTLTPTSPASPYGMFSARSADAAPELPAVCSSDEGRFDAYAVEVHGRSDRGTFVARCGAERFGSGWPPELVLLCQDNLPVGPTYMGSGMVYRTGEYVMSQVWVTYQNESELAIESVASDARVIPGTWGFGTTPIEPFDTSGWGTSVSFTTSAMTHVSVQLDQIGDALGSEVCPIPRDMPMPGDPPPPVFLLRLHGIAGGRSFASEAMVSYCTSVSTAR